MIKDMIKKLSWRELSIILSDSDWFSDSCIDDSRDLEEEEGRDSVIKELLDYDIKIFI